MLDGCAQIEKSQPRILGVVQIRLEEPLAKDIKGRVPVAVSPRQLRQADEMQGSVRIVICPSAVRIFIVLELQQRFILEIGHR
jgi:hypothetical protein